MMIDHICSRLGRRRLSSISTSGWHGSRFDGLAAAAVLIVVGILTPAADAQTCTSLTDSQVNCLGTAQSTSGFVQIACVSEFYKLTIQSATLYQASSSGTGCPTSGLVNPTAIGACSSGNQPVCTTTASSCIYGVRSPSSNVGSCTGPFFVITTYLCSPVFSAANSTTGSSTFMDNTAIISNTQVNMGNPTAPTGLFFYGPTSYTCSVYVPAGVEVKVGYNFITKTTGSGCQWRIEVDDIANNPVVQFCNSSSPQPVSLGCGPNPSSPQYFLVRYVGDSTVGIFFAIYFQVRQGSQVAVQCGMPPFPLYSTPPTTTTAAATSLPATTLPPVPVTTAAAAVSTAGATSPPPTTPSPVGNGLSTAATSGAPNPVVTTAPSNPAATSVFPTPTLTNSPAAPATSNTGLGGVTTSAAGNLVVTTAPSNNVPTSAPVTPSPTLPSNNAGATSVPSVPTLSPPAAPVTTAGAVAGTSPGAVTSGGATGSSISGSSRVTQPSTPVSGGVSGWDQNATTGVIAGSVVAGAIILSIVATVALWRRRSTDDKQPLPEAGGSNSADDVQVSAIEPVRSTNYQLDPNIYSSGPYRHVTGFYVDGNSRSNLVINRPMPPPPPQPFKTVLRLQ